VIKKKKKKIDQHDQSNHTAAVDDEDELEHSLHKQLLLFHVDDENTEEGNTREERITYRANIVNQCLQNQPISFRQAIWTIFWCSVIFMTVVLYDKIGDEIGAIRSLWLPLSIVLFSILTRRYLHDAVRYFERKRISSVDQ
jgi:hypothetical protein